MDSEDINWFEIEKQLEKVEGLFAPHPGDLDGELDEILFTEQERRELIRKDAIRRSIDRAGWSIPPIERYAVYVMVDTAVDLLDQVGGVPESTKLQYAGLLASELAGNRLTRKALAAVIVQSFTGPGDDLGGQVGDRFQAIIDAFQPYADKTALRLLEDDRLL